MAQGRGFSVVFPDRDRKSERMPLRMPPWFVAGFSPSLGELGAAGTLGGVFQAACSACHTAIKILAMAHTFSALGILRYQEGHCSLM